MVLVTRPAHSATHWGRQGVQGHVSLTFRDWLVLQAFALMFEMSLRSVPQHWINALPTLHGLYAAIHVPIVMKTHSFWLIYTSN